jgi:hypothetical protein
LEAIVVIAEKAMTLNHLGGWLQLKPKEKGIFLFLIGGPYVKTQER